MEVGTTNGIGGIPQGSAGDWAKVLGRLKEQVGETAFRSWFRSMTVERITGGEGIIAVPTRFLRNWVATHYSDRLLTLWKSENNAVQRISFVVMPHGTDAATAEHSLKDCDAPVHASLAPHPSPVSEKAAEVAPEVDDKDHLSG